MHNGVCHSFTKSDTSVYMVSKHGDLRRGKVMYVTHQGTIYIKVGQ
jgi:hypothetical protein